MEKDKNEHNLLRPSLKHPSSPRAYGNNKATKIFSPV